MEKRKKQLTGKVTSAKMDKVVKVAVEKPKRHPVYRKVINTRSVYMAHCTDESVIEGSVVTIEECKPYSKNVKWKVVEKK